MLASLLAAVLPVLVATGVVLVPGVQGRRLAPARTFALFAALAVVLWELLPAAMGEIGLTALGVFVLGLLLPRLAGAVWRRGAGEGVSVGAAAALGALALHQLVDGVEIGIAWALATGALAVTLAIAAHSIPLIVALLLTYGATDRRGTILRGVGLAAATGLGAALGHSGSDVLPGAESWLPALLAGLLVHVLWHAVDDLGPQTAGERALDLGAALAGFAGPAVLLATRHEPPGSAAPDLPGWTDHGFGDAVIDLFVAAAPALLVGLAAAAAVQAWRHGRPPAPAGEGTLRESVRGVVAAASEPLCAVSAVPLSERLHRRGTGPAMVVAFLLAAPELGPDAFAMSARFLGWEFAALRWVSALVATLVAAGAVARFAAPGGPPSSASSGPGGAAGLRSAFDETVLHVGPLVVAGIVVAALIQVFVLDSDLARLQASGWSVPVVSFVALPTYVSSAAGSPLAAVLWSKGLGPGAALCWVLVGPVTNAAVPAFLVGAYGRRAAAAGLGAYVAVAWVAAAIADAGLDGPPPAVSMEGVAGSGSTGAAVVLAALLLRSMWQAGAREWLGEIAGSGAGAGHRHVHGHDHDHDAHGHGH